MNLGGNAAFKIADDLQAAVDAAAGGDDTRAIQIKLNTKAETCEFANKVSGSMEDAWGKLNGFFEDGIPSLVLFKDDNKAGKWALCSWIPEDVPVKPKMLASSVQKNVKSSFEKSLGAFAKDYKMMERSEVSYEAYEEYTKELTEDDRHAAMTRQEIVALEAHKDSERERESLVGKKIGMIGLGAVTCSAHETFEEAVKAVAMGRGGEGMIAKITGVTNNHQVEGNELDDVNKPADLASKLDDDVPCYVLMHGEDDLLLFISWLPESAPVKPRMNVSTFKRDVVNKIKQMAGVDELIEVEVSEKKELVDSLAQKRIENNVPQAASRPAPKPAGPMAGAFKLPGLP